MKGIKPIKYCPFRITACRQTSAFPIYYTFYYIDKNNSKLYSTVEYKYFTETRSIKKSSYKNDERKTEVFDQIEDLSEAKEFIIKDFNDNELDSIIESEYYNFNEDDEFPDVFEDEGLWDDDYDYLLDEDYEYMIKHKEIKK